MVKLLLLVLSIAACSDLFAQSGRVDTVYTPDKVMHINKSAYYPSGEEGLMRDVAYTYKFPKAARKEGVQGKIIVQFTVNEQGHATDPKILRGLRADVDTAAIEMTQKLLRFEPATMDGRPVPMKINVPLTLK
ncbi:MAG: energy transducer TonB [Flavobacteriales bacterium]|nr:energy transducer TonB [Flavobacteriales bacterium]